MKYWKYDSLFFRMACAQIMLLGCCLLIIGGLMVVQRNQLLAPQYAIWLAPHITAMGSQQVGAEIRVEELGITIRRRAGLPAGLKWHAEGFPAAFIFASELSRYRIATDSLWVSLENGHINLWVRVQLPGSEPYWLSGNVPFARLDWQPRMTAGVLILIALTSLVSWRFTLRVTRPLNQLRQRMQLHAQIGSHALPAWTSTPLRQAPPELVEMEKAYKSLAERQQRNEHERALLLAGVSHDLRSPLSRIRLAAEMLPETADNAGGVASITRNVDLADRLTATFLEYVRTSAIELNQSVDLAAVAHEVIAGFERPEGVLQLQTPPSLVLHHAHELLFQRLLVNLIDNALKYGSTPVNVVLRDEEAFVRIIVADTGAGLPQGEQGELLHAFARGDASRNLPGFGLGLAIVQQIVSRLQGTLEFAHDGAGHQVIVRLPCRPDDPAVHLHQQES